MPSSCTFTTEYDGARTVIRLSGAFDRGSALELRDRIDREDGSELVLDFSLVRDFADLGVATLAAELGATSRRLALRGLRTHQLRIFRYFGVDPDALETLPGRAAPVAVPAPGTEAQPPIRLSH